MTDTAPASGVDLARAAFAAARAAAKNRPVQPQQKKPTRTRRATRSGDPMGLGSAITTMMTERGWEPPEAGGSIIDQWPTIAPELADKVHAVRFEHDTGTLHLRPVSDAYATRLRMYRPQIIRQIHDKTGHTAVRELRILAPGWTPDTVQQDREQPSPVPASESPAHTRATKSDRFRRTFEAHQAAKAVREPANPYIADAIERQNRVLADPRNREPETAFTDAVAELERASAPARVDRSDAVRRAALARKRQDDTGAHRRAFDVA